MSETPSPPSPAVEQGATAIPPVGDVVTPSQGLFPLYSVGCFTCTHTVRETSPKAAHDVMERHYAAKHGPLIRRLIGNHIVIRETRA